MPQGSRPEYRIKVEKNVPAKMRDGVTLYADVYRPDADGRFPVILLRLPTAALALRFPSFCRIRFPPKLGLSHWWRFLSRLADSLRGLHGA